MAVDTNLYPDGLLFDALMEKIAEAKFSIDIGTFIFKTSYASPTRANAVADALIARARSIRVRVLLNFSRTDPDVRYENYQTAILLAAGGCEVRLGPPKEIFHEKISIFDQARAFVGSHNITRGGLSDNRELTYYTEALTVVNPVQKYYDMLWYMAVTQDRVPVPLPPAPPIKIELLHVTDAGAALRLDYDVNHTRDVDAFAAVAAADSDLVGARMGLTVPPTTRSAIVIPDAATGEWVHVAVRAYSDGEAIATSGTVSMQYQPTAAPPEEAEPDTFGDGEGLPPAALVAPTLSSVELVSPDMVTVTWVFVGASNFLRFVVEQRNAEGDWVSLYITRAPATRQWTGAPDSLSPDLPFRVVVYNTAGEKAVSNEVALG